MSAQGSQFRLSLSQLQQAATLVVGVADLLLASCCCCCCRSTKPLTACTLANVVSVVFAAPLAAGLMRINAGGLKGWQWSEQLIVFCFGSMGLIGTNPAVFCSLHSVGTVTSDLMLDI